MADRSTYRSGACLAGALVMVLLGGPADVAAQSWRTMTVSRQIEGTEHVAVQLRYGAGEFRLSPAVDGLLYRMELRYDEDTTEPIAAFDGRRLELGVESQGKNIRIGRSKGSGSMDVALGRGVPMSLEFELGAVEATFDLGGLSLTDLDIRTGASASSLDVSEPNPETMRRARLQVGAAEFSARRLGNLNADHLEVGAGVGDVTLDFSGRWQRDLQVEVQMGVGSLQLRFPEGMGVRLVKQSLLTSLDSQGLIKRGDAFESPDWDSAQRRITIDVQAAFGSIDVVWLR